MGQIIKKCKVRENYKTMTRRHFWNFKGYNGHMNVQSSSKVYNCKSLGLLILL